MIANKPSPDSERSDTRPPGPSGQRSHRDKQPNPSAPEPAESREPKQTDPESPEEPDPQTR